MNHTPPVPGPGRKVSPRAAARILGERDPVIAHLVTEVGLPSFPRPTDTNFGMLVRSVTYQQLAVPRRRRSTGG